VSHDAVVDPQQNGPATIEGGAVGATPETQGNAPEPDATASESGSDATELLVEEVSIDGLCGVY
jgi:mycofactocin precursor